MKRKFQLGDRVIVEQPRNESGAGRFGSRWVGVVGIITGHHISGTNVSEYKVLNPDTGKSRWIWTELLTGINDRAPIGREVFVVLPHGHVEDSVIVGGSNLRPVVELYSYNLPYARKSVSSKYLKDDSYLSGLTDSERVKVLDKLTRSRLLRTTLRGIRQRIDKEFSNLDSESRDRAYEASVSMVLDDYGIDPGNIIMGR